MRHIISFTTNTASPNEDFSDDDEDGEDDEYGVGDSVHDTLPLPEHPGNRPATLV